MRLKENRLGETQINNYGSLMTIVEYKNNKNVTVKFESGYTKICTYIDFKSGKVESPYCKTVSGVGYLGEGDYKRHNDDKRKTIQYDYWRGMLQRCYNEKMLANNSTYKECEVCEDWHNFQNFAKWFDENYYEIDDERIHLDKDILKKGNKIYSPNTCMFVPQRINNLFTKNNINRGDYPIGVRFDENRKKFYSGCSVFKNNKTNHKFLGRYNTPEEAFYSYKEFKEKYIKEVADEYKDKIPTKLYEAMYKYIVEIND